MVMIVRRQLDARILRDAYMQWSAKKYDRSNTTMVVPLSSHSK